MGDFRHIMRIGTHAEADFFRKLPQAFDLLMINANLLCGTPAASAAFIHGLGLSGRKYIIDPFTHAFPLPPRYLRSKQKSKGAPTSVKRTFVELARRYFPESTFVGIKSLGKDEFDPRALAQNVLKYQSSWYEEVTAGNEYLLDGPGLTPAFRIAPYFTMSNLDWMRTNLDCLSGALEVDPTVAAVIAVTLPLLKTSAEEIARLYSATGVTSAFLWIENFDEDTATRQDLESYCDFVALLSQSGVSPMNLFGGFFSCIAADYGLSGFAHGLVYGENKAFAPVVGGGQPPPRYYFKPLHIAQNVLESQSLLLSIDSESYVQDVCDCAICQRLVKGEPPAKAMSKFAEVNDQNKYLPSAYALCRFHFMLARRDEVVEGSDNGCAS